MQGKALTEAIRVAFEHFAARSANGFVVPEWLPTPSNRQYSSAVGTLDEYVYELIRSRRAALGEGAEAPVATLPQAAHEAGTAGNHTLTNQDRPAGPDASEAQAPAAQTQQSSNSTGHAEHASAAVPLAAAAQGAAGKRDLLTALVQARDEDGTRMADTAVRFDVLLAIVDWQREVGMVLGALRRSSALCKQRLSHPRYSHFSRTS